MPITGPAIPACQVGSARFAGRFDASRAILLLELLRRSGMIESFQPMRSPEASKRPANRALPTWPRWESPSGDGHQSGAAYGNAKRWLPERFAEVARRILPVSSSLLVFGSSSERPLCDQVIDALRGSGIEPATWPAKPTLREFIDLTAACRLFLTNDSGAMHVASALAVPTVAVFGATDDTTTGPPVRSPASSGARRMQPMPAP